MFLMTKTCILTLSLSFVPVPRCLAADDLLVCVLAILLSADQVSSCSSLWSLSNDSRSFPSCNQQMALPATLPLVPLCVLTPPVTTTRGAGQEVQEKPSPVRSPPHHSERTQKLWVVNSYVPSGQPLGVFLTVVHESINIWG